MRQNDTPPPLLPVRLAVPLRENDQRQDYLRSRLLPPDSTSPLPRIEPLTPQDSSMLSALAYCNALLLRPPFDPARQPGEILQALLLDPGWGCE
jgi:molybdopterin molybdotransferase